MRPVQRSVLLVVLLSGAFAPCPPALGDEAKPVAAGTRLERELGPGTVHRYRVEVPAGYVLKGTVEQRGVDVVVRLLGPDGAKVVEIDSPNGTEGVEPIDFEAKVGGAYTLEVEAFPELTVKGRYELRIDGVLSPADVVAERAADKERDAAAVEWLREHGVPLASVRAGSGFDDLAPLRNFVGDARVVALGEATHGTREFFQLKHRLLEFLVSEMGFTAFGIEATLPESFDVDSFVTSGDGDGARALAGLYFWTWNTEEVMDLLEWMRAWNADPKHVRKVRFYGFDMQFSTRAARIALEALEAVDSKSAARLRGPLAPVLSAFTSQNLRTLAKPDREALDRAAGELASTLSARDTALAKLRGREDTARALRCARVLVQNLEMEGEVDSFVVRDRAMAENALWALAQEGTGGRIVLWAHNGHVLTTRGAMGGALEEALGAELRVIGFAFGEGAFQSMAWPPPLTGLTTHVVRPLPEGTLDSALTRSGHDVAFFNLRSLPREGPVADWFARPHPSRSIGAIYSPELEAQFMETRLTRDLFDGLLFVRMTSAARAMPTVALRATPQFPSPWNLDFELGEPGSLPAGWAAGRGTDWLFGYRIEAREGGASGKGRNLCILRSASRYGGLEGRAVQHVTAGAFRGKRVRLSGSVRAEDSSRARVSLYATTPRLFPPDPMASSTPLGPGAWKRVSAELNIPPETVTLALEISAEGLGTACFDDLSLDIVAMPPSPKP